MFLSKLEIDDFLAYEHAKLEFGRTGLVLLVGPNNAGKSALLKALDVVAGKAEGGNWRRVGAPGFATVTATFKADDDGEQAMILGHDAEPGWPAELEGVQLTWEDRTSGEMLLTEIAVAGRSGGLQPMASIDYSGGYAISMVSREAVFAQRPPQANWDLQRTSSGSPVQQLQVPSVSDALPGLGERYAAWQEWFFHFAPIRAGADVRVDLREASPKLEPTGANLPRVLLYHQSRNSLEWHDVNETLNAIIPDAGEVQARADRNHIDLAVKDPATGVALNLKRLGTGVEQILMAAYVGATQPVTSIVLMEEPEAGLHPGAQRLLLQHLLDWARTRMLIVSTHSTVFLDHARPDNTQTHLVQRENGVATVTTGVQDDLEILRSVGVRLSDVASAARVLLVEGDSDEEVLRAWFGDRLVRARIAVVPMEGGDKAFHTGTVMRVIEQADKLHRDVLFLRDRDELSDDSLAKLTVSSHVHVLRRRELENYLLDPDAIAAVLGGTATASSVQTAIERAMDGTRNAVLLKSAVAQLPVIRVADRRKQAQLLSDGAGVDGLVAAAHENTDSAKLEQRIREAWASAEQRLDAQWDDHKAELAPGEEVLVQVWRAHGAAYDKQRDGPEIAARMSAPPPEIEKIIERLEGDLPL